MSAATSDGRALEPVPRGQPDGHGERIFIPVGHAARAFGEGTRAGAIHLWLAATVVRAAGRGR